MQRNTDSVATARNPNRPKLELVVKVEADKYVTLSFSDYKELLEISLAKNINVETMVSALLKNAVCFVVLPNIYKLNSFCILLKNKNQAAAIDIINNWITVNNNIFLFRYIDSIEALLFIEEKLKKNKPEIFSSINQVLFTDPERMVKLFCGSKINALIDYIGVYANQNDYINLITALIPAIIKKRYNIKNDLLTNIIIKMIEVRSLSEIIYILENLSYYQKSLFLTDSDRKRFESAFNKKLSQCLVQFNHERDMPDIRSLFSSHFIISMMMDNYEFWMILALKVTGETIWICQQYEKHITDFAHPNKTLLEWSIEHGGMTELLERGVEPHENAVRKIQNRNPINSLGEFANNLHTTVTLLEFGANPVNASTLIDSINNNSIYVVYPLLRIALLKRTIPLFLFTIPRNRDAKLLPFIYEIFPNVMTELNNLNKIYKNIHRNMFNLNYIEKNIGLGEFMNLVERTIKPNFTARNIYLNLCIILSQSVGYPLTLPFDVLMIIIKMIGIDKSRDECHGLLHACRSQKDEIKLLLGMPGGLHVNQRTNPAGGIQFRFFKSAVLFERDYEKLSIKLKSEQTRSISEVVSKQTFSADSSNKLAEVTRHTREVVCSNRLACGMIQERFLNLALDRSPFFNSQKQLYKQVEEFLVIDGDEKPFINKNPMKLNGS